jgi:glutathione S-transferase
MAKMKLYYSPGSPYARKVRVVALETRLDRKMEMVTVAVSPVVPNADVVKHNPIGKVPALSVKGMDLFDSPVICEYLDSLHKGRSAQGPRPVGGAQAAGDGRRAPRCRDPDALRGRAPAQG